jgi:cytochrome c-type biogenesis protein CcmH/NrfG
VIVPRLRIPCLLAVLLPAILLAPGVDAPVFPRPAGAQVALSPPRPRPDEVEALRTRAQDDPRDPEGWAEYARALIERDTVDDRLAAQRALKRAVALAPKNVEYRLALADLYTRQNYLTLARRQLTAALGS